MKLSKIIPASVFAVGLAAASALSAQQAPAVAVEGMDFDTLAACSIVYQQVSQIYTENGEPQKSTEFTAASSAYAASALHMLGYSMQDPSTAAIYGEKRMGEVATALNAASQASEDGDMGVITEWLPFCDELGTPVNSALARREARGW